jgi:tetratricopeptide (TPR) repeat protein
MERLSIEVEAAADLLLSFGTYVARRGRLGDGVARIERSLKLSEKLHGSEHVAVALRLHELALVLRAQGDLDGARKNLERSLEIQTEIYGNREHYSKALSEWNLGRLLQALDEPEAAQELLEHAYQVFLSQLGPEHPYTRRLGNELGFPQA